jgi:hypothetical protein
LMASCCFNNSSSGVSCNRYTRPFHLLVPC